MLELWSNGLTGQKHLVEGCYLVLTDFFETQACVLS